jgi:hypothetical protein
LGLKLQEDHHRITEAEIKKDCCHCHCEVWRRAREWRHEKTWVWPFGRINVPWRWRKRKQKW